MHYCDPKDLEKFKEMQKLAPEEFKRWAAFDGIVGLDGKIPRKYRELIAVAAACVTQCPYCLDVHAQGARKAGATREELAEASLIAAALRAGGGATHGALALKLFDEER